MKELRDLKDLTIHVGHEGLEMYERGVGSARGKKGGSRKGKGGGNP